MPANKLPKPEATPKPPPTTVVAVRLDTEALDVINRLAAKLELDRGGALRFLVLDARDRFAKELKIKRSRRK